MRAYFCAATPRNVLVKNGAIPSLPLIFIVHPLYSILLISTDTDVGRRCWPTRQREGGMFFICVYPFPPFWWRTRPALNLSRAPCGKREHLPATHAPLRPSLLSTRIECGRGHLGGWIWMWHPNYLHSYPLKTPIWISVFVFDFNMDVIDVSEFDFLNFFLSESISISEINAEYPTISVSTKKR